MKYIIFGDIHGCSIKPLEQRLEHEDSDVVICLGDFDQVRCVHEFIELENRLTSEGKKVIKVPGNHDHAIINHIDIHSGTLHAQHKNVWQLIKEFDSDSVAKKYLDSLVNSKKVKTFLDKEKYGNTFSTIVLHGGYAGTLYSFPDCPENAKELWYRMESKDHFEANLDIMRKKRIRIMIRGHDHEMLNTCEEKTRVKKRMIASYSSKEGSIFPLHKDERHIINPGAYFEGYFATIEIDHHQKNVIPILKYHHLQTSFF